MMPADRTERKPAAYEQTTVTCAEPCLCLCHKKGADCSRCNIPISEIHKRASFAGGGKGQGWSAQEREFGKEILRLTAELARVTKERDEANAELAKRKSFMDRAGFRVCDIAACNCDEWHNPHMSALSDALDERVSELATLKQERDELRADNLALLSLAIWTVDGLKAPWGVFQPAKLIVEREKDAAHTAQQEGTP